MGDQLFLCIAMDRCDIARDAIVSGKERMEPEVFCLFVPDFQNKNPFSVNQLLIALQEYSRALEGGLLMAMEKGRTEFVELLLVKLQGRLRNRGFLTIKRLHRLHSANARAHLSSIMYYFPIVNMYFNFSHLFQLKLGHVMGKLLRSLCKRKAYGELVSPYQPVLHTLSPGTISYQRNLSISGVRGKRWVLATSSWEDHSSSHGRFVSAFVPGWKVHQRSVHLICWIFEACAWYFRPSHPLPYFSQCKRGGNRRVWRFILRLFPDIFMWWNCSVFSPERWWNVALVFVGSSCKTNPHGRITPVWNQVQNWSVLALQWLKRGMLHFLSNLQ